MTERITGIFAKSKISLTTQSALDVTLVTPFPLLNMTRTSVANMMQTSSQRETNTKRSGTEFRINATYQWLNAKIPRLNMTRISITDMMQTSPQRETNTKRSGTEFRINATYQWLNAKIPRLNMTRTSTTDLMQTSPQRETNTKRSGTEFRIDATYRWRLNAKRRNSVVHTPGLGLICIKSSIYFRHQQTITSML